jgi:hypothetical protein
MSRQGSKPQKGRHGVVPELPHYRYQSTVGEVNFLRGLGRGIQPYLIRSIAILRDPISAYDYSRCLVGTVPQNVEHSGIGLGCSPTAWISWC